MRILLIEDEARRLQRPLPQHLEADHHIAENGILHTWTKHSASDVRLPTMLVLLDCNARPTTGWRSLSALRMSAICARR